MIRYVYDVWYLRVDVGIRVCGGELAYGWSVLKSGWGWPVEEMRYAVLYFSIAVGRL